MRPMLRTSRIDVSARKTYDLLDEPTGGDYDALLECALVQCTTAVVTVPAGGLDATGQPVIDALAPYQQARAVGGTGSVVRYGLTRESVAILQGATRGLYGWRAPLAENLCIYRADGSPWLVSIADARIGYLEVSPFEKLLLGRTAPGLVAVLVHQGARDATLAYLERRFEGSVDALTTELLGYANQVIADGREGLVDALEDWLASGEQSRIAAALEVTGALEVTELRATVAAMLRVSMRPDAPTPAVYRANPTLRERWRIANRRRLTAVLERLSG